MTVGLDDEPAVDQDVDASHTREADLQLEAVDPGAQELVSQERLQHRLSMPVTVAYDPPDLARSPRGVSDEVLTCQQLSEQDAVDRGERFTFGQAASRSQGRRDEVVPRRSNRSRCQTAPRSTRRCVVARCGFRGPRPGRRRLS